MRRLWLAGSVVVLTMLLCAGVPAHATLIGLGPNALVVTESISDLGAGVWEYSYDFQNTDTSKIWHFLLYTSFDTFGATSTFPNVAPTSLSVPGVADPYDATNIDSTLTDVTNTWYTPFGGPNGLDIGSFATLAFKANVLDSSAKLFAYETVASGYAVSNEADAVAAYGHTGAVPEPASMSLLGAGLLALAARRRRR